jgi:DNA-binding MarR family transcriptional regulator
MLSDTNHEHMHAACESLDLTPGVMKALLTFDPATPKPMRLLATEWRCDASYVTSVVDALEAKGIVERLAHPTDRRAKLIALTADGLRTRQLLLERLHEPPQAIFALTTAEQRTLSGLLRKIVEEAGVPTR